MRVRGDEKRKKGGFDYDRLGKEGREEGDSRVIIIEARNTTTITMELARMAGMGYMTDMGSVIIVSPSKLNGKERKKAWVG